MWARQLGQLSGVSVPNQAAEHYYLLTEPMEDVGREWPVVEDPSSHTYIRPEGGGLMVPFCHPACLLPSLPSRLPSFVPAYIASHLPTFRSTILPCSLPYVAGGAL